jgi:hypothetical protein
MRIRTRGSRRALVRYRRGAASAVARGDSPAASIPSVRTWSWLLVVRSRERLWAGNAGGGGSGDTGVAARPLVVLLVGDGVEELLELGGLGMAGLELPVCR